MNLKLRGRLLAPLAIIAGVVAIATVFGNQNSDSSGDRKEGDGSSSASKQSTRKRTTQSQATKPRRKGPTVYVVKSGDLLSTIAEKTGVAEERLRELNPDIDPQALVIGQRVKLRE